MPLYPPPPPYPAAADDPPPPSSSGDSCCDGATSFRSLPSLLHPISPFHAASYLCLTSLKPLGPSASTPALAVFRPGVPAAPPLLYSASPEEITILDLTTLRPIDSFAGVPSAGAVKSVAISPDGSTTFTAHQDGRIRAWRRSPCSGRHSLAATIPTAADRLLRLPLPSNYVTVRRHRRRLWIEHDDVVASIAAVDGLLYSVSWDKTLKIWRAAGAGGTSFRCLESVRAHDDAVNAVAVACDGTVYTGSADGRIRVWTSVSASARGCGDKSDKGRRGRGQGQHDLVATLEMHRSAVNALAVSSDGAVLYSGACDRSILVWEREEATGHVGVVGKLRGHEKAVLSLACAGDVLFSGSSDRTVRIWRRKRKDGGDEAASWYTCAGVMDGHVSGVRSLVAVRIPLELAESEAEEGEEEYWVCSAGLSGEVLVWRVRISDDKGSVLSCSSGH